ncbi:cytochrome P450 [Actinomadura sp. 9N215]|uniref:cytochrome P450 n=1 Tax=Actinomadura sp. 9N215 TaxID=3375150 RepID=UPI0037B9173E
MTEKVADHEALPRLGPEFALDPYPVYRRLRESGPVQRVVGHDGVVQWIVTRYDDVKRLLVDPRMSSALTKVLDPGLADGQKRFRIDETLQNAMTNHDPPEHTRIRKTVVRAFSARRVEAMRPRVQELTDTLLDAMDGEERVDLIEKLATPVPVAVSCEILGVPVEDRPFFNTQMDDLMGAGTAEEKRAPAKALTSYMAEQVAIKRASRGDDVLSAMIEASEEEGRLTDGELVGGAVQLLFAGYLTTIYAIGAGAYRLLKHPEQLAELRRDPGLLPKAVEELLRFDGPVIPGILRYAKEDVEVGGTTIPAHSLVVLSLTAANRDPDRFPEPDRLDIHREDTDHVAFGGGIHYCIGARLATIETEVVLGSLIRRFPRLELAVPDSELRWELKSFARHIAELPVFPHGAKG